MYYREYHPFGFLLLCLLSSCGIPDLKDPAVMKSAFEDAVSLETLERKRMYGMIMLYVDNDDEPYTGWVKSETNGKLSKMGYLKNGQKQGVWMTWHPNSKKKSEIEWKNDQMYGSFQTWHKNGKTGTVGQTTDGEVDGEWKEFYENGSLEAHSENKIGTLVNIEVFLFNGDKCNRSEVVEGKGTFVDYDINGSALRSRTFENGIETKSTWLNLKTP